jgi:RNA polymerase sigma-70 factor (ECF subfamily)
MVKQAKAVDFNHLVSQAQLGNSQSMDRLIRLIQPRLEAHLYRGGPHRELVGDLVQEVFLKMIENLSGLRNVDSFWPWLLHIASNRTKDYSRRRKRTHMVQFSTLKPNILEDALRDNSDRFRSHRAQADLSITINESVSRLDRRSRAAVRMRCLYDMSYLQIGGSLACSEGAVRVLFMRARRKLKTDLQKKIPDVAMTETQIRNLSA